MSKKKTSDVLDHAVATTELAAPKSRIGTPAPWVPGQYPRKWAEFSDEQLQKMNLVRPSGAEFAHVAPEAELEVPSTEQDPS